VANISITSREVDVTQPVDQLQTRLPADVEALEAAIQAAVREALARHKQAGNPIAVWENGQVEWIAADQIDLAAFDAAMGNPAALTG
jgi:hypothetical protein